MDGRASRGVWLLAAGQTLVWAALYYSFAALLPAWTADLGRSPAALTLGLTLALLVSATLAPVAGRLIDEGRGPILLTGGALMGAALMAALSLADSLTAFLALWTLIGAAQAGCLYEPCFAFVTRRLGPEARPAITRITLVAGFASTLAFPAGAFMAANVGWRGAALGFAALAALGAALLRRGAGELRAAGPARTAPAEPSADRAAAAAALARPAFWLLAASFPLMAFNHGALINNLLPLLADRGFAGGTAVLAASLVGPMQVAGRVALMTAGRATAATTLAACAFLAVAAAAALLMMAGPSAPALLFAFVALQGAGYGVSSILRPAATAERLGAAGFGVISGRMALPYLAAAALAPFAGAALAEAGGWDLTVAAVMAAALLGAAGVALAARG